MGKETMADVEKRAAELTSKKPEEVRAELERVDRHLTDYVSSIKDGASVGAKGSDDGPFANLSAAERLAKFHDLTVEAGALRKVDAANVAAEAHKEAMARRLENGDTSPPVDGQDALLAMNAAGKPRRLRDVMARAIEDGKFKPADVANGLTAKFEVGDSAQEKFDLLNKIIQVDTDNTGYEPFHQDFSRVVMNPLVQINLKDIVPRLAVTSDRFQWQEQTTDNDGTAYRLEGAQAAESNFYFTQRERMLRILSARLVVSDELIEDNMFLQSLFSGRLAMFFNKKLGDDMMSGTGNTQIDGFAGAEYVNTAQFGATSLGSGGAQPAAGTASGRIQVWYGEDTGSSTGLQNTPISSILALNDAATNMWTQSGERPDAVVMSPATWQAVALARDGENNFVFPQNMFAMGMVPMMGVRVVQDANVPAGRAFMTNFMRNTNLVNKGGVGVEMGLDGNDFSRFQKTMRISGRFQNVLYQRLSARWVTNLSVRTGV